MWAGQRRQNDIGLKLQCLLDGAACIGSNNHLIPKWLQSLTGDQIADIWVTFYNKNTFNRGWSHILYDSMI